MEQFTLNSSVSKKNLNSYVIGSDQICSINNLILNKPLNTVNAIKQLKLLSGKTHKQTSAICLYYKGNKLWSYSEEAKLTMHKLNISASKKFIIASIIIIFILYFDNTLNIKTIKFSFMVKEFDLSNYSILLTCFCFLVFLNAFNMFDGINLQSSIYSIIIFLSLLIFYGNLLIIKIILISILTYTYLNLKNKSFLGDSGSLLLAFLIGYLFIKLYNFKLINFTDEVVLYMLLPGVDLIRLFFKRIYLKRNPLTPDRFHLHHLLLSRYSYKKTLIILFSLIILPLCMNNLGLNNLVNILSFVLIYTILIAKITKKN